MLTPLPTPTGTIASVGTHSREVTVSYWCTAVACSSNRLFRLGDHQVTDPLAGLVWLGWRAGHIAHQLRPPLARPVWAWREDEAEHQRALAQLARYARYPLSIPADDVMYILAVTPASRGDES